MAQTMTLKDFQNRIIGYVEIKDNGDKTLKDFHNRILGYYDAKQNVTKDFYNHIVGRGDILTSLLK